MGGTGALAGVVRRAALVLLVLGIAAPAAALELADGRVQIHGFYESQIRTISDDFQDDFDLTQWYHVLNIEIEADVAPDGFGPFDLITAFSRIEVRYDCVWTRSCGLFRSADMYGDRPGRQAKRVADGRRPGFHGNQFTGDTRSYHLARYADRVFDNRNVPVGSREPVMAWQLPSIGGLFGQVGPDGVSGTPANPGDDPPLFVFSDILGDDCLYNVRKTKGSANGVGSQILPWTPGCKIRSVGELRDKPNPFSTIDRNEVVLGGATGRPEFSLPLRPAPDFAYEGQGPRAPRGEAQGIFIPNERLAQLLRDNEFDNPDVNFREAELAWNRGASQQDEKELRELYLDIEMFDSRLWIRAGKQTVVWGKTELFRNQDQFNPQDLGLTSLPSLEESRIPLWAIRAVWSFWEVGPFSDVRLEVAANLDQFEPADLGRCGEPYAPYPACTKANGLQSHSLAGVGIAGEVRPEDPWNSWKGLEVGARLEWRWDRFSFSISDFYGYTDTPYAERLFQYSRNVDPRSGLPRQGMSEGDCVRGTEEACLEPDEALERHSGNQQAFAMVCGTTVGVTDLDLAACAQSVFNSRELADPTNPLSPHVALALTNILSGQNTGLVNGALLMSTLGGFGPTAFTELAAFPDVETYVDALAGGVVRPTPLVSLVDHGGEGGPATLDPAEATDPGLANFGLWASTGIQPYLNDAQEGFLGCGDNYNTRCDVEGIDLLNTEASVLFQSWPVIEGTFGTFWDTTDASVAQPGTKGFQGGPVATRFERGQYYVLPGANVQVPGKVHPFTGQQWDNELAIVSWNFLMGAVGLSTGDLSDVTVFDPSRPFADDRCSMKRPQLCSFIQGLIDLTSVGRPSMRAAGNGRFGRRDFTWVSGADVVLRYEKRNVLGFSMDWAEDVTKSNWSIEATWMEGIPYTDQDADDYISEVDTYNLTVSVDRPTFVNFLNSNRTFFLNAQVFFQYVDGYSESMTANGPWNVLATFTVSTGYFQDRMLPAFTVVYDKRSNSGAFLPQVSYRFNERFSATFGAALFMGRWEERDIEMHPIAPSSDRVGRHRGSTFVENGLAVVRDRDELFLRIRYTF